MDMGVEVERESKCGCECGEGWLRGVEGCFMLHLSRWPLLLHVLSNIDHTCSPSHPTLSSPAPPPTCSLAAFTRSHQSLAPMAALCLVLVVISRPVIPDHTSPHLPTLPTPSRLLGEPLASLEAAFEELAAGFGSFREDALDVILADPSILLRRLGGPDPQGGATPGAAEFAVMGEAPRVAPPSRRNPAAAAGAAAGNVQGGGDGVASGGASAASAARRPPRQKGGAGGSRGSGGAGPRVGDGGAGGIGGGASDAATPLAAEVQLTTGGGVGSVDAESSDALGGAGGVAAEGGVQQGGGAAGRGKGAKGGYLSKGDRKKADKQTAGKPKFVGRGGPEI